MQKTHSYIEAQAANGIFYRSYGNDNAGVPLVLIMGYGGCMFAWPLNFVGRLAEKHKVIIFDNRGTGRSAALPAAIELRMHHFASDLKEMLSDLQISKANLFGYSMGGCVAIEFAKMYPEIVDKLVLQSTTAGGAFYTGADQEVKDRLANPRGSNFDEMLFDFYDLCMSQASMEKHKAVLQDICNNARPYPTSPRVLQPQLKSFRNFDASQFLNQIANPALVLHGSTDRIVRMENGLKLSEHLPASTSIFIDNCGHAPHIEYEDTVIKRVHEFLS